MKMTVEKAIQNRRHRENMDRMRRIEAMLLTLVDSGTRERMEKEWREDKDLELKLYDQETNQAIEAIKEEAA